LKAITRAWAFPCGKLRERHRFLPEISTVNSTICFLASASAISEFHTALGQFINYRAALRREEPDRILYLAVPNLIYNSFFQLDFPASMLQENSVKIIVYDIELEQISLWKE